MKKTFYEFIRKFFNKKQPPNVDTAIKNEMKKIIEVLSNIRTVSDVDDEIQREIDRSLGMPHKIEFFTENDLTYEKTIWHTPDGDIVKITVHHQPITPVCSVNMVIDSFAPLDDKSLEEKLADAVKEERYETAARLRDEIAERK